MNRAEAEICCGSWKDVMAAYNGGARRIELNSALYLGGLTPSLAALRLAKEKTNLKVIAMVRPRGAGFHYCDLEAEEMFFEARLLLENGADGLAFGFLRPDGKIDQEKSGRMIELIHSFNKEAVFHRAFDCCGDGFEAIQTLIDLKADRLLTSGMEDKAIDALPFLKQMNEKFGKQIEILAGSGVNAENAVEIYQATGIKQLHSSCKTWEKDPTTSMNHVSYRYHAADDFETVDEKKVAKFVEAVKSFDTL